MEQLIKNFQRSPPRMLFFVSFIITHGSNRTYQLGGYAKYLYSNTDNPSIGRVNDHFSIPALTANFFLQKEYDWR